MFFSMEICKSGKYFTLWDVEYGTINGIWNVKLSFIFLPSFPFFSFCIPPGFELSSGKCFAKIFSVERKIMKDKYLASQFLEKTKFQLRKFFQFCKIASLNAKCEPLIRTLSSLSLFVFLSYLLSSFLFPFFCFFSGDRNKL